MILWHRREARPVEPKKHSSEAFYALDDPDEGMGG